ncbi:MAG: hypothetical protein WCY15_13255 [Phenylobacterium sp.]|jgi:methyl-accepting chemotaxis protein|uniref:hypothetical protein n=1 Tax=Phenylobacterium sp. TaxID=1871053 RepID=UPI002A359890|nr:hypothetical protein [Phenylobacterium sp.]MDX9998517.1 hypothetical protein [Phenylobacterium sp.]
MSATAPLADHPPEAAGPDLARACASFRAVAGRVQAQAARAEDQFLALGQQLTSAFETLSGLVSACEEVAESASDAGTAAAADALRSAADQVAALGGAGGRRQTLEEFLERLDAMSRRIEHAQAALRPAGAIAVSAKVEAVRIGDTDVDFGDFAVQISDAFGLARQMLRTVAEDAGVLREALQEACEREADLARRIEAAVAHLPPRITASVEAILAHMAAAGRAAETTADQSRSIRAGIGDAVMATQVGDSARQRMEHVVAALELAEGAAAEAEPLPERRGALALAGEVAGAHLIDTGEELLADMRRTLGSLAEMGAASARLADIDADLGSDRGGAADLAGLRADVAEAQALFAVLEAAWRAADELARSVAGGARQLERRIGAIRDAEIRVARLAMNASIKCGRVGERGRALAVVAQQLQACVDQTTEETAEIVAGLGEILALAERLADSHDTEADARLRQVAESFDRALEPLAALEARTAERLDLIRRESAAVARLLQSAAAGLAVHQEIAAKLQAGAAELASAAEELRGLECRPGPIAERLLEAVAASYTMARERSVHAGVLGRPC